MEVCGLTRCESFICQISCKFCLHLDLWQRFPLYTTLRAIYQKDFFIPRRSKSDDWCISHSYTYWPGNLWHWRISSYQETEDSEEHYQAMTMSPSRMLPFFAKPLCSAMSIHGLKFLLLANSLVWQSRSIGQQSYTWKFLHTAFFSKKNLHNHFGIKIDVSVSDIFYSQFVQRMRKGNPFPVYKVATPVQICSFQMRSL